MTMNRKFFVALNVTWATVAVAAYLAGPAREREPANPGEPMSSAEGEGRGVRTSALERGQKPSSFIQAPVKRDTSPSPREDPMLLAEEVKALLAEDVDAAKALVAAIESDWSRQQMERLIVLHYASTDLDATLTYIQDVCESKSGYRAGVNDVVQEILSQRGVEALEAWIEGIDVTGVGDGENRKLQSVAAQRAVRQMAKEDPDRARTWIIEAADRNWFDAYDLERVAMNVDFDPSNQLDWVASLPDMPERQRCAIGNMFSNYGSVNLAGAGEWLAGQELSQIHDEAIRVYAFRAAEWDPEAARDWAAQISDEQTRTETLDRLVQE